MTTPDETRDVIDHDEYLIAFPLVVVFPETPSVERVREVMRASSRSTFPGATAAEAGRAAESVGRVDPFN